MKSAPSNLSKCKASCKTKKFEFGTKNDLLWYFQARFEKYIIIYEIKTFEFVKVQSFMKKNKKINLGPKMLYLGIFTLELKETIVIFEISTFEFFKMQSFMLSKKYKFRTKIMCIF